MRNIDDPIDDWKYWLDEWNAMHIKHAGKEDRNDIMADWLEVILDEAKTAYYTSSSPTMNDKSYDRLEADLRMLRPTSYVLTKVGYTIK